MSERQRRFDDPPATVRVLAACGLLAAATGASAGEIEVPEPVEVCVSCHALTPDEPALEGPSLWRVAGRRIASLDSFDYSTALRQVDGHWDRPTLERFLAAPQAFAPGTKMTLGGVRSATDRAVVLDFLATLAPEDTDAGADR